MRCENCGYQLNKEDLICPECGTVVTVTEKKPLLTKKIAMIASAAMLLVVAFVIGIIISVSNDTDNPGKPLPTNSHISQNKDTIEKQEKEKQSVTGNGIIKLGDKYICSDKKAIYIKNKIDDAGIKLVDMDNTANILCDGKVVYYTVSNNDGHHTLYAVDINGGNPTELFTRNNEIELVCIRDNHIYYIDCIFESGKLTKFEISSKTHSVLANAMSARYIGKKIYYSMEYVGQNIEMIDRNQVEAIDLETEETEVVAKESTLLGSLCTDKALYFASFSWEYDNNHPEDAYSNLYVYTVDSNNNVTKSEKLPDGYRFDGISASGSFAMLAKYDGVTSNKYYQYRFDNKQLTEVPGNFAYGHFKNDLADDSVLYSCGFPANSTSNVISILVSKVSDSGCNSCKVGGNDYVKVSSYDFWFIDGKFVDENLKVYEITAG